MKNFPLNIMAMKTALSKVLRRSMVIQAAFDYFPVRIQLFDGSSKIVPRRLWRLYRPWRNSPGIYRESRRSYDTYHGGDVLDVGAYHGWYSFLLAPKANKGDTYVSLEPDLTAIPDLLFNLSVVSSLYPGIRTFVLSHPVGDGSPSLITFPQGPSDHPQFASGSEGLSGAPTATIDMLVTEFALSPTFVKIDVEGAEYYVVRGMQATLKKHRPTVMLELHPKWQPDGITIEDVRNLLKQAGYLATTSDASEVAIREYWSFMPESTMDN
jgi:FkbM family methyltransferase